MHFTSQDIANEMGRSRIVPLFTHEDEKLALDVITTAYEAGIRTFEFTNRRPNSAQVFQYILKHRHAFPEMMLGIGTVMDASATKMFIEAGADFIISPIMKPPMAEVCHRYNKMWIPGCATLTEIAAAKEHGAQVIKVFPGSVLGPGFVSAVLPVIPDLRLMITGGVEPTEENLSSWFKAGAFCVGMGSQLFTSAILREKDWNQLHEKLRTALALAMKVRN